MENPLEETLRRIVRTIPDFPRPGILFKDITPVLSDPALCSRIVDVIAEYYSASKIDAVAAVEARGFIFGMMIAGRLRVPFVPVRKSGKLPYQKVSEEYDLEYGKSSIEMHADSIERGWNVLVHDDLLATGGTASASGQLVRKLEGNVAGFSFIVNLCFLTGEQNLTEKFSVKPHYLLTYP